MKIWYKQTKITVILRIVAGPKRQGVLCWN